MDKKPRISATPLASVYPLYVQRVAKKGRTMEEVDQVVTRLTGYGSAEPRHAIDAKFDFETFFARAAWNPNVGLSRGLVCGMRVEDSRPADAEDLLSGQTDR